MSLPILTDRDREELAGRGISEAEALRQLTLFASPPIRTRLLRPCTLGDGIQAIGEDEHADLLALHAEAAGLGRLSKLVPASGAASRMMESLAAFLGGGASEKQKADVELFLENLPRFAFHDELQKELLGRRATEAPADPIGILRALLGEDGLGLGSLPKALLPFHRYGGGTRTAFEEQLVEAAATIADSHGACRVHFTVSAEHRSSFEARLAWFLKSDAALGHSYDVTFSEQSPATDTLAVDAGNRPFREVGGRLVFRPGGHGALLSNLARLAGDLVLVKNIDNIQHRDHAALPVLWERLLAGSLVRLEREQHHLQARLANGQAEATGVEHAVRFLGGPLALPKARTLGDQPEARRDFVLRHLFRPLRVAGVVKNAGEPGGGPFWVVNHEDLETPQIVESSQVDLTDAEQARIQRAATHFNPVAMALSLRDFSGRPYDLAGLVDERTVLISKKSKDGRELKALERPGLWNGAMAGWLTVFVEIPAETFAPVKTVLDLLRREHQLCLRRVS